MAPSPATVLLLVLGLVVFRNFAEGTLPSWFRSKFFNGSDPTPVREARGDSMASTPDRSGSGRLLWNNPLPSGSLVSHFGDPRDGGARLHEGIDLAAPTGTRVRASRAGRVTVAGGGHGGYGNLVTLEHDGGWSSRYAHLSAFDVRVGDQVNAGAVVGRVGATGNAQGPHLHFEIHNPAGVAIDPLPLVMADTSFGRP